MTYTLCPYRPWTRLLCAASLALALGQTQAQTGGLPIQQWSLPNGAQVYLIESPILPMLDLQIDLDAGSRRDPTLQAGLASVTARMSNRGLLAAGAQPALDDNQLSEAWADLGASFDAGASSDRFSFSLRTLTYPDLLAQSIALAARQIAQPAFPDAVWQRERARMTASLRESRTRPGNIAGRAFNQAVYGNHPYGFEMTEATLDAIDTAAMRAFYRDMVLPCRARVSLVGAVSRERADRLVRQLLAGLPQSPPGSAGCPRLAPVPEVEALTQAREIRQPFAAAQAQVLIGQPGYRRDDPDFFALTVGNYILGGGGFVSRLTNEVREKRGLSYSVYSFFAPGRHAGAFTLGLQTRPDQAAQALEVSREVLARFVADGPSEAELQAAKDNLIGGFALRIDSNRKLLDNIASMAWNDLPLDYLSLWTQKVAAVTTADVRAAFARKLQPQRMVTVVVGAAP